MNYYLAVDIGASSGRHIIAFRKDGKLVMEEIYRFDNGIYNNGESLCWDLQALYKEIIAGLKKCKEIGKIPVSMGIDTWAVDFVLLDKEDQIIGKTVSYRDIRTQGMDEKVYEIISEKELYQRNGIQKLIFNTIYQLMAIRENRPEHLLQAKTFLMIPDYFNFLLTGKKSVEYTNATTTSWLKLFQKTGTKS
jgi:rhamnulokinase